METARPTSTAMIDSATIKLAAVLSTVAALLAIAVSALGDVPNPAIVLPVIVVGFALSWVHTNHVVDDDVETVSQAHADRHAVSSTT